jgi:predicted nucleic acid-binding protein
VIAVDASALVDKLTFSLLAEKVERQLVSAAVVAAPDLVHVEVASTLRRLVRLGQMTPVAAEAALDDLAVLPLIVVPHRGLLRRAWAFRESVRVADAFYLACADELGVPLLTSDSRLARGRHGVPITLVT